MDDTADAPHDTGDQPHEPTERGALATPEADAMPITVAEYRSTAILLGFFVVCILLAVLFAQPFFEAGLQAFEDPEDPGNAAYYIVLILVFTFVILWIAKKGIKWLIQAIILGAVGMTIAYVFAPLLLAYLPLGWVAATALAFGLAAAMTFWLYKHPEWYVIDLVGLIVAAGAAAIFGISLAPLVAVLLLAGLAIYDAIAVYRTKHMLSLADTVIDLRLPVLLVVPKTRGYSFLREAAKFKDANKDNKEDREAMFMGLGDLVMPTILVISAFAFLPGAAPDDLDARFGDIQGDEGLTIDHRVLEAGAMPLRVEYTLDAPAHRDAAWTFDHDLDDEPEAEGTGLPATVVAEYDEVASIGLVLTVGEGDDALEARMPAAFNEPGPWWLPIGQFLQHTAALGAALGTLVGFGVLMTFVLRGNPQAGLPLLNGGAIVGFLIGLYAQTGSFVFW